MIINKIDRHKRTVVKTAVLLLYSKKLEKLQKTCTIRMEKLQNTWGDTGYEKDDFIIRGSWSAYDDRVCR